MGDLQMGQHAPKCLANMWAKHPRRCGFTQAIQLEVAGDVGAVLMYARRPDGQLMRFNFSKAEALKLAFELENAARAKEGYGRLAELEEACR